MAERAMAVMNHRSLKGRPMRIMWSLRDPMARRTGVGNLFVKNLEEWIGGSELEELFKEYGFVVSCKVALDENGNSKGFGFVQMGTEEGAQSAIKNLHGKVPDGGTKQLYVSNFVKKSQREALSPQSQKYTNLYVKNLEADFTDDLLRAKFSEFGDVASAVIMKDELGKSRGFGFVTLKGFNQAMKAMDALNGSMFGSKKIYVGFAQKKALREEILKQHFSEKKSAEDCTKKGTNVYVKCLAASVNDKTLKIYFSICGEVVSAKVMRYPNGISKGFGFVSYSSPEEATKAVTTLHGALFHGNSIYVAMAQRKEERQKVLQIQFAKTMAQSTSYSRPAVYPLPHYWQPRNYVHYQGYKYLYPVTVPVYYRQQSAYTQYAASVSSQMQNSVHLSAYPQYAASASS
ncbi:polyadenylate-binding protein 7-like [Asparagus officinalis]|uniref:polyadenylate-binding protein 7-like n=1 Tax=Asparagus officinalis TaxID=4686 RepID=UPI00098E02CD|nr:polyadenylate-binding protein 7-like [Asparagus officinalis]